VVEVALVGDEFDFLGPEDDSMPPELLRHDTDDDDDYDDDYRRPRGQWVPDREEDDTPDAARLRAFLSRVLNELGLPASIHITEGEEELFAEITGEDMGIFIGRRGQTIDAVEYLASIAVFSGSHSRRRVELDAEGYKDRRRRQIERVALRKAEEAAKRGRPVQLTPMTPAERKIVHLTLRGRTDVLTASQGREPNRCVVITPAREARR
jgi:spoIIIJ-associated protein